MYRAKLYTDGTLGTVTMGLRNCKSEDEGEFCCILTNAKGKAQFDFKLFVTVEGGMDFRAMLMKKKVKQKKIVVQRTEWIEPLFDIECQENRDDKVVMSARLSVKGLKGKWYHRNETIMMDIKAGENGRELARRGGRHSIAGPRCRAARGPVFDQSAALSKRPWAMLWQ